MTSFGFVINNRTCIGCHACSTACKSENEVPLGVYRTWVKYTEVGTYPDVRRSFQVTRCNHCNNPPCVRICPVTAMYRRDDGIVEFDQDVCIGCKACMQACPYDAIYVDPDSGTIAKCHYCSHRTDVGLEPACVVVCPEHAIIAGDMNDPSSEISRVLAKESVSVRKPEQGTSPKLFYIEGNDVSLRPTATEKPATFMWADVQEPPAGGPIHIGTGRQAEHMVQVGYNAQHKLPWHWPVPAYLVTKAIGAGVVIVLALLVLLGIVEVSERTALATAFTSLVFTGITTVLLVADLERPERFLRILLRPQWKSWLVRGAFILIGFTLVITVWLGAELLGATAARIPLLAAGAVLGVGTAIYTAFLFGQAEGRDLWQSTLLPVHLLVQAVMIGAGTLAALAGAFGTAADTPVATYATFVFGGALVVDLFVTLFGEMGMRHASEHASRAAAMLWSGELSRDFWWGSIAIGHVVPLVLLSAGGGVFVALALLLTAFGLYRYEHAFVMAPQKVANS